MLQGEPVSNKPESSITFVASSRTGGAERVRRRREGMFHILAVTGAVAAQRSNLESRRTAWPNNSPGFRGCEKLAVKVTHNGYGRGIPAAWEDI